MVQTKVIGASETVNYNKAHGIKKLSIRAKGPNFSGYYLCNTKFNHQNADAISLEEDEVVVLSSSKEVWPIEIGCVSGSIELNIEF